MQQLFTPFEDAPRMSLTDAKAAIDDGRAVVADVRTQSDYTAAHREATLGWMTSIYRNAIAGAAADRKQAAPAMTAAITGPSVESSCFAR